MLADSSNLAAVGAVAGIVATVSGVLVALLASWRAAKSGGDAQKQSIVEFSQAALKDLIAETRAMNATLREDLTAAYALIDDLRQTVKDNERECERRLAAMQSQLDGRRGPRE